MKTLKLDEAVVLTEGHGEPDRTLPSLRVQNIQVNFMGKRATLTLQYGAMVDGEWISKEQGFVHHVRNIPAVMNDQQGSEIGTVKTPADPQFDDFLAGVVVAARDVGSGAFDVVSDYVLAWLVAQNKYEGTLE